MRKKSINDLLKQLKRVTEHQAHRPERWRLILKAYNSAFVARFDFEPHSYACGQFVRLYGKDFKV